MTDHLRLVDADTLKQRIDACCTCPHHDDEPVKFHGLCMLSGAVVDHKARITTEHCPTEDPDKPDFNRWGQWRD